VRAGSADEARRGRGGTCGVFGGGGGGGGGTLDHGTPTVRTVAAFSM